MLMMSAFKKIRGGNGAISLLGKVILQSHSFFDKSVDSLGRIYLPTPGFNFTFVFKINAFVDSSTHILRRLIGEGQEFDSRIGLL
mgnify:CR=1 FL=1